MTTWTKPQPKYWVGDPPEKDDFGLPITQVFVDGRTQQGPWATMSMTSFIKHGVGLGQGAGQKYRKQRNGRWLKVEG